MPCRNCCEGGAGGANSGRALLMLFVEHSCAETVIPTKNAVHEWTFYMIDRRPYLLNPLDWQFGWPPSACIKDAFARFVVNQWSCYDASPYCVNSFVEFAPPDITSGRPCPYAAIQIELLNPSAVGDDPAGWGVDPYGSIGEENARRIEEAARAVSENDESKQRNLITATHMESKYVKFPEDCITDRIKSHFVGYQGLATGGGSRLRPPYNCLTFLNSRDVTVVKSTFKIEFTDDPTSPYYSANPVFPPVNKKDILLTGWGNWRDGTWPRSQGGIIANRSYYHNWCKTCQLVDECDQFKDPCICPAEADSGLRNCHIKGTDPPDMCALGGSACIGETRELILGSSGDGELVQSGYACANGNDMLWDADYTAFKDAQHDLSQGCGKPVDILLYQIAGGDYQGFDKLTKAPDMSEILQFTSPFFGGTMTRDGVSKSGYRFLIDDFETFIRDEYSCFGIYTAIQGKRYDSTDANMKNCFENFYRYLNQREGGRYQYGYCKPTGEDSDPPNCVVRASWDRTGRHDGQYISSDERPSERWLFPAADFAKRFCDNTQCSDPVDYNDPGNDMSGSYG